MRGSAPSKLALGFFYLVLEEEDLAIQASANAIKNFKKRIADEPKAIEEVVLIQEVLKSFKAVKKRLHRRFFKWNVREQHHHLSEKYPWPGGEDKLVVRWKKAKGALQGEEEIVLLLRYVLKQSVTHIAEAMDLPQGTILYRIGRGLQNLQVPL